MNKKRFTALLALLLMLGSSFTGYGEEMQDPMGGGQESPEMRDGGGMNRSGQMRGGRPGMNPMMMQQMMGGREQVVATSDGGVVVLAGPKLSKYDAQLNLIKEIEIHKRKPSRENQAEDQGQAPAAETTPPPSSERG